MKITVKKEMIIERERTLTIKFGTAASEKFCDGCRKHTLFITIDEAALLRQTTVRHIFQLVETDRLHYYETANGLLLICFQSLSQITDESFLLPEKSGMKNTE